jgi:hypothetical protein
MNGAAAGLDGQSHRTTAIALADLARPLVQVFRGVGQGASFGMTAAVLQSKGMLRVAPIQANPGFWSRLGLAGRRRVLMAVFDGTHNVSLLVNCLVNVGRSSYSVRGGASAPEYAYPRSGYGSGRKVALNSSSERDSMFVPEPNPNYHSQPKMGIEKSFDSDARRRRCSPSERRRKPERPCSTDEQRRESYTRLRRSLTRLHGINSRLDGVSPRQEKRKAEI